MEITSPRWGEESVVSADDLDYGQIGQVVYADTRALAACE